VENYDIRLKHRMKLNITKPLIIFDLETTGLDLATDRIIQISYIKVEPNGDEERKSIFVNPEKPIPLLVQELTHITDDMVKDAPTFKQLAKNLQEAFSGCDFAGFNSNRFDIPMLAEEFLRAGVDFDFQRCRLIDAQTIFHKMEPRNLAAAYRFYTGNKMEDDFQAHRADEDAEATYRVLQGQLDKYNPENPSDPEKTLANDMDILAEFSTMNKNVDFAGRIVWKEMQDSDGKPLLDNNGKPRMQEVFNFGKYKGWAVADVVHRDPGFCSWMLSSNFTLNTKQVLTRIQLREAKLNSNF
jgi:DNA polymerase-3 subunit epsilon